MIAFDKDKAYMEVLCQFRKLIDSEYKDGGWLPPVREMSKRFNVSPGTYRKSVNCMVSESIAESYPRKGIYILPEKYRIKKIGVVIGDGKESPYLVEPRTVSGVIDRLSESKYSIHMIQGSPVANVVRSAVSHYVSGLIWIEPSRDSFDILKNINYAKLFPMVVINTRVPSQINDILPEDIPFVSEDHYARKKMMVDFFLERNHKKLGYVGAKLDADITGLTEILHSRGIDFDENCCADRFVQDPECVKNMILDEGITALIVEGQLRTVEQIFTGLSMLPADKQPEVISREEFTSQSLRDKYPKVNLIAVSCSRDKKELAMGAVDILLDNLKTPDKIETVKVKSLNIKLIK